MVLLWAGLLYWKVWIFVFLMTTNGSLKILCHNLSLALSKSWNTSHHLLMLFGLCSFVSIRCQCKSAHIILYGAFSLFTKWIMSSSSDGIFICFLWNFRNKYFLAFGILDLICMVVRNGVFILYASFNWLWDKTCPWSFIICLIFLIHLFELLFEKSVSVFEFWNELYHSNWFNVSTIVNGSF